MVVPKMLSCFIFLSFFFSFKDRQYNMRKLTELPTALIGAERWELFIESICCIPFVEVSVSCTSHQFKTNVFFLNRHTSNKKKFRIQDEQIRVQCKSESIRNTCQNGSFYYCNSFLAA